MQRTWNQKGKKRKKQRVIKKTTHRYNTAERKVGKRFSKHVAEINSSNLLTRWNLPEGISSTACTSSTQTEDGDISIKQNETESCVTNTINNTSMWCVRVCVCMHACEADRQWEILCVFSKQGVSSICPKHKEEHTRGALRKTISAQEKGRGKTVSYM